MYISDTHFQDFQKAEQAFEKNLYRVVVPKIFTYTPEEIELYGVRISDPQAVKVDTSNDPVEVYISPKKMFEIFRDGGTIRIRNAKDIKEIYETVQGYLRFWKQTMETMINKPDLPDVDLVELDHLAQEIFNNANHYFSNDEAIGTLKESMLEMSQMLGLHPDDIEMAFKYTNEPDTGMTPEEEREMFENFFKDFYG